MRGDKQIVTSDGLAGSLKPGSASPVFTVGRDIERQYLQRAKHGLDLRA